MRCPLTPFHSFLFSKLRDTLSLIKTKDVSRNIVPLISFRLLNSIPLPKRAKVWIGIILGCFWVLQKLQRLSFKIFMCDSNENETIRKHSLRNSLQGQKSFLARTKDATKVDHNFCFNKRLIAYRRFPK